jgi:hypothetical protein
MDRCGVTTVGEIGVEEFDREWCESKSTIDALAAASLDQWSVAAAMFAGLDSSLIVAATIRASV